MLIHTHFHIKTHIHLTHSKPYSEQAHLNCGQNQNQKL